VALALTWWIMGAYWLVSHFLGLPAALFALQTLIDALTFRLDGEEVGSVAVGVCCVFRAGAGC
jgi:hypothetical protein